MTTGRSCPVCGLPLTGGPSQKTCGTRCRVTLHRELTRGPRPVVPKRCKNCRGWFSTNLPNKVYCSERCRHHAAYLRERRIIIPWRAVVDSASEVHRAFPVSEGNCFPGWWHLLEHGLATYGDVIDHQDWDAIPGIGRVTADAIEDALEVEWVRCLEDAAARMAVEAARVMMNR